MTREELPTNQRDTTTIVEWLRPQKKQTNGVIMQHRIERAKGSGGGPEQEPSMTRWCEPALI